MNIYELIGRVVTLLVFGLGLSILTIITVRIITDFKSWWSNFKATLLKPEEEAEEA